MGGTICNDLSLTLEGMPWHTPDSKTTKLYSCIRDTILYRVYLTWSMYVLLSPPVCLLTMSYSLAPLSVILLK